MRSAVNLLLVVGILFTVGIASADYVCVPKDIDLLVEIPSSTQLGSSIVIFVSSNDLYAGNRVDARLTHPNGYTSDKFSLLGQSKKASFSYLLDQTGTYKFIAWAEHPIQGGGTVYSEEYSFEVRAPLQVSFNVNDPQQYTVRDMELTLTVKDPNGVGIQNPTIILKGYHYSTEIQLSGVGWTYQGNGIFNVVVPASNLREGTMSIQATVSYGNYDPRTVTASGINVVKPTLSVEVNAPISVECNDAIPITVVTKGYLGTAVDADYVELTITHPDGITKETKVITNSRFAKGNYKYTYIFNTGPNYQIHAYAKMNDFSYYDGGSQPDPIVVVSGCGTMICEDAVCGVSGDSCCPIPCTHDQDLDCPYEEKGIPWLIYIVGAVLAITIIIIIIKKRK